MKKILLILPLFVAGFLIAGLYGVLHDQLSYSVSPEYFTRLKFTQFHIPPDLHNRLGAGLVGWKATWWMGLPIGAVVIPTGLIIKGAKKYFVQTLRAFLLVAATAFIIGVGALGISYLTIQPDTLSPDCWHPEGVIDVVNFARVGCMHNFSYLGGLIGIISGVSHLFAQKKNEKTAPPH